MSNNIINEKNIEEKNEKVEKDEELNKKVIIPQNLFLLTNISNSFSHWGLDNAFITFNYNDISYLIYSTIYNSIISYNINERIIDTEIKNAHGNSITNYRYYHKKKNNKLIIMSISGENRNIKLWDFVNWECILNLSSIYKVGLIFSSCFLIENNNEYIIICGSSNESEIKIYDFSGVYIKSLNDSKEKALFIDCIIENFKIYIITGNEGYIKSYDYKENILYHKYKENGASWHCSIKYIKNENILKLLDSCWGDEYIRIWDFHLGSLISKIETNGKNIKSLCIYNDNILFVGCYDWSIRIIDIKNKKLIKSILSHKDCVCTIKKIINKKNEEYIITEGIGRYEMIKIWLINKS